MMSRPMVLIFLLLVLIITSQFEWKQQLMDDFDHSSSISEKQQQPTDKEELFKEKIILLQEKSIRRLSQLVQSLQQQLLQCQGINNTAITGGDSLVPNTNRLEAQESLED
ncbi:hypothetical protein Taro_028207 [Colocasia esculenta]|uniref:Uncharacterized protein n=1 Tax=Colocasia esculenta TaxID=4460 RepID=A0A843VAN9_COLES|nr:hypothetical protein [Colocasia esculenta]